MRQSLFDERLAKELIDNEKDSLEKIFSCNEGFTAGIETLLGYES